MRSLRAARPLSPNKLTSSDAKVRSSFRIVVASLVEFITTAVGAYSRVYFKSYVNTSSA